MSSFVLGHGVDQSLVQFRSEVRELKSEIYAYFRNTTTQFSLSEQSVEFTTHHTSLQDLLLPGSVPFAGSVFVEPIEEADSLVHSHARFGRVSVGQGGVAGAVQTVRTSRQSSRIFPVYLVVLYSA